VFGDPFPDHILPLCLLLRRLLSLGSDRLEGRVERLLDVPGAQLGLLEVVKQALHFGVAPGELHLIG
jgi:hypothetical protein